MSILRRTRRTIRKLIYGDTDLPQEFTIGLTEPQRLMTLWLHGLGAPLDVTQRYATACCAPLILAVSLDAEDAARLSSTPKSDSNRRSLSLQFREQTGAKRLLGELRLTPMDSILCGETTLLLCHVRSAANFCLSPIRGWAHFVRLGWQEWRRIDTLGFRMTFLELRAAIVTFIRPHPLSLVSVVGEEGSNIFPMNLMGELGHGLFAFALKDSRLAAHLVERAGHLAVSNLPMQLCSTAVAMAINHTRPFIDLTKLSFALRPSATLQLPVPALAPRVRELEVLQVHKLGSHNLFIARILSDEHVSDSLQVNIIHGFYQHWLCRGDRARLQVSLAEHRRNKPA